MEEDYVKTGEDKKYEYYRNDSEVLSDDDEAEIYGKILKKKDVFNVKINNKNIKIKKRTLNKLMILSNCEPEEQILFSLYKTIDHNQYNDIVRKRTLSNQNLKNTENPENPDNSKRNQDILSYKKIDEPLSENNSINNNVAILNIPNTNDNRNDNENLLVKKTNNADDLILTTLPPQAVQLKWFYLLLVLCGLANIIYFFYCTFHIHFLVNPFFIMIFGLVNILTGFLGYNKINKKIYNDNILFILTIANAIFPIINIILIATNILTKGHIVFGLILNIITIIFAILCLFFTQKLKNNEDKKIPQMERLL